MINQQTALFAVVDEPYLLWDEDIRGRALEFLDSIDPGYFEFLSKQGEAHLGDDDHGKHAAAACRIGFFHGAETLFLLLGALLQAPHSPQAFIGLCKTDQLRELRERITLEQPLELVAPRLPKLSWEAVARLVHARASADPEQVTALANGFASFWQRLDQECSESTQVEEHNSLKHGFRVGHGGIQIDVGPELNGRGEIPKDAQWHSLGGSKTGSSFYRLEVAGGDGKSNRSRMCSQVFVNWSHETMIVALQLVACSINNVLSALRLVNGAPAGSQPFKYPTDPGAFARAWATSPALRNASINAQLNAARSRSKDELLREWRDRLKRSPT